ncbi:1053_t:CDS:2 [Funneliformis caledonium]|uniref:1053_t:CDS:1 n=1 Tax=Funneliformis caledonium TaxID=1117310 RepID=A0A9N9CV18_9GLOM|nr:1053_t:CDS:2 [Funneliformis caledonium]
MISTLESTGEHTSNTSNKEITEGTTIAKILLLDQGKNNENIKFLKGRRLEYMAQHCSRFNNDLSFYAEEYIKINSISSIDMILSEDVISLYITDDFFKDIFFTQLAVIKEDELFDDSTVIDLLKIFLKQAFILHLTHEVSRLTSPNMDNHYTLQ